MSDTADLDGTVTRLDVAELDKWCKRVGHVARGIERQLYKLSSEAPEMLGGDRRLYKALQLRDQHEAALNQAHLAVGKIAKALAALQAKGKKVTDTHTDVDADNAAAVHRAGYQT